LQTNYWLYERILPHTTVIDIGAFIGDTALYFAMNKNVDRVIAFEPMPLHYGFAKDSLKESYFRNKITLVNKAIVGKNGKKLVSLKRFGEGEAFHEIEDESSGVPIKTTTLQEVLDGIKGKVVIKSNSEGAEYETFIEGLDLSKVYSMMIQIHHGPEPIKRILEKKGFHAKVYSKGNMKAWMCIWR
jgi:FkbM family methyltransferase